MSRAFYGYKCTAPPNGGDFPNNNPSGGLLTAMTFSFLFGPSSVTESFLLDANLPAVAVPGSCEVATARV